MLAAVTGVAAAGPTKPAPVNPPAANPAPSKAARKDADRHFKTGVGLFERGRYAEALSEFERAYELAPHPIVLYNIAGCHRELLHYRAAVAAYQKFLAEGGTKVPAERLAAARSELDALYARTARVTVTLAPSLPDATLSLDGEEISTADMPLLLAPGEHRLTVRAGGKRDADKIVRVASGDELSVAMELDDPTPPTPAPAPAATLAVVAPPPPPPERAPRFAISLGGITNLPRAAHTGAPALGLSVVLADRLELGVDATFVAYAVVPTLRVRVAGDRLALHLLAALPIAFNDGDMSETFVAGGGGLGVRYRLAPRLGVSVESYVAYAGKLHGTTVPTFLRGELWF